MSLDELRNEARFYMYDDDDDHMSLFEAFVCHTSKDLGPIDKDWFSKERDSQISDCSDFRSSGSVSSDQCTPVASPCLSRDKDGTPKSTVRTPASASTCQLNNSLLEWTPLLPSPPATKVFKTPDVPKTFSQSLGVNLATPSPLWSPSLETPPNKSKCKQDGKVVSAVGLCCYSHKHQVKLAPRNLFHLPGKNQQSVSSEGEDVLEDEEFKDVLSDREENPSLVSQSPKEKSLPVIVSNKYIGTAPAHQPCIEASSDTSGLALRHSSSSTDYNLLKPRAEGCLSRGDVQLFNGSTNMRKDECFMSTDEVACKKAQLTAVATHSPASKMDSTTFSYPVLCQTSSCFRPPPRKQNITALTILAMPSTVTMLNSPAVMHSSSHSDPSDGSSKDFSFSEDKSDSGRPDLSLTQMFEVAESTIACIEATDVGFTQCISSGSEAQSGHGIDNTGSEGSSQRPEEKQASVMQQLPAHTDICHSNSPAPFKKEIEVSQSLGITGKHVGADVAAGGCMISTGFKTGSGKPVVVLESSLAAAKGKLSIFDQAFRETEGAEKQSTDYESSTVVHDGSRSLESMAELDSVGNGVASLVEAPKYGKNCTMQSHKKADVHHSGCAKNECQTAHDCIKEEPDEAVSDKGTQDSSSVVFGSSRALKTQSSRTLPCQSTFTSGFTTATGKPVYIQEENLNHARQLFSEPSPKGCSEKLQGNTVPPVLLTDAEEMTTDSTYKLVKQKTLPATVKAGFMTAGGQPVYIQAAALSRAQRVLSKVSAEVIQADLKDESTGKAVNISVNSLMKSGQHDNSPFTSGFMTAGGKPVYIQEEGLSHARQLFSEANREVSCVEWTVNGVPAQPTTDAAKLKTLVNSLEKPEVQPGTVVSGFMTAGGKPVYVQEEALNHAHHAFMKGAAETSQISVQSVTVPTSFTTGAGKIVNVSVDSLVKSKERHDSFTSGFTPAEGKAVCIQEGQKVSTGFMTGSGKMVSVSKSSLVNAKNMLSAGCADTPSLGHCTSERDAASPDPGQGIENGGEGVQRPSVENYTPSGSSIEVRQKALESRQEALKEESKYNTPTNPLAVHTSDRRTPASGLSRLGLVGSPMFSSKLKPAVKTPNFVTPFKAVSSSKAQTPLTASKAAAGPRTLFQKKAIQPGKLWILRKVTKAPRLSLRDALRGQCPKLYTLEELRSYGVLDSTALVNSENAANFVFHISSSDGLVILGDGATMQLASTEVTLGRDEFCLAFLGMPGVDKNLVAPGWVDNHYRWIVWKLASMELHCPEVFGGRTLTPDQVMFQLKYRYDIEIDNSCRSALRKIYEKDDVPSKTLVLCVSDVVCREDGRVHLELTDGWYSIRAELDEPLSNLVSTQRIFVGLKLIMSGAELVGASEACAPLEAPKEAALKISYNSTRRARWDARLGYFAVPRPFRVPLASLHPKGGLVGKVDCLVIRAYPVMYLEMLPNGMGVMRREKEEMAVAAKHEKLRTAFIEKLTAEVLSQVEKSDSEELPLSGVRMAFSVKQIQGLNSGRDIWKAIRNSSDPSEIERLLTEEQLRLLRHFQEQQLCLRQTNIQQKLESALQAATEENKCPKDRVVIPVLKVLLGGIHEADLRKNICCLISVWRPTDDTREMLKQGKALSIYNVNVTTPRKVLPDVQNSAVELSTTKMTQLEPANCPDHIRIYYMRQVTSFPVLLTESGSQGRAVDIVGLVLRISQQKEGTVLTLTDSKLNFIQLVLDKKAVPPIFQSVFASFHLNFIHPATGISKPQGLRKSDCACIGFQMDTITFEYKMALEGNIQKGEFLSATDVTLRQGSTDRLATLETTEFSAVTTSPAAGDLQRALSALKATIQDPPGFIAAALAKLQAPVHVISPRLPTSHFSPLLPTKLAPVVTPTGTTMRMAAVASGTPVKPKRSDISDSDGLLLPKRKVQVEPGSPAEALSKQVRSRIAILERYAALEPIPLLATPQSTKAKMPFRSLGTPTVKGCPIADSVEDSPQMDLD